MRPDTLHSPAPANRRPTKAQSQGPAENIYQSMRIKIAEVYPDDDLEAWRWEGEDFETHVIPRPEHDFKKWLTDSYQNSDEFSKQMVNRMFSIWDEQERAGFKANDLPLYEHQKALFAWIAIRTVTGIRGKIANLLARSPYGSGKSLVAGLVIRAFKETQEEMMAAGTAKTEVPTGILLGLRREHALQNTMGTQFAALQPPYTVDRKEIGTYWKNLDTMFGPDFSTFFTRPTGTRHPFYRLFDVTDDTENPASPEQRIVAYLSGLDETNQNLWRQVTPERRKAITDTLEALIAGKIVLIPDVYNVPQAETPLPRADLDIEGEPRYAGDSAYALTETPNYRIKATHRQLALNRKAYTTQPDPENPAQFCITYGTMVTRAVKQIRGDICAEIMPRARLLVIDETGACTPGSLNDSITQLSGQEPYMVGFTGQDRGVKGWTDRSPILSITQMVRLGLMKPIGFQVIGDAQDPPAQGTEEAWEQYAIHIFEQVQTATTLQLPQPYELDTVVVAPAPHVREYAHRILEIHNQQNIPVKVWCFDPAAGNSRWSIIVNGFNAPKHTGDPRRVLVAPPSQIAEALHLNAECYDILANMSTYAIDQTRGRLGHIQNRAGTPKECAKARTYFRVQCLRGGHDEAYIRIVASKMGFKLPDDNAQWKSLHSMIDLNAYERDTQRKNLGPIQQIPDTKAVQKRKQSSGKALSPETPLKATSSFVIEKQRLQAEQSAERSRTQQKSCLPKTETKTAKGLSKNSTFTSSSYGRVTIIVDENGQPVNLENIAEQFNIHSLKGVFINTVMRAFRTGNKRGAELAEVAASEIYRLCKVQKQRQQTSDSSKESGPSRYIGVETYTR